MGDLPLKDLGLPDATMLAHLLGGEQATGVAARIAARLVEPARELVSRPCKSFRARLVRLGYELVKGPALVDAARLDHAAAAIELLHAGSLIVDDIQDGSPRRRGAASLHLLYGVPEALCTGNWLYFYPLRLIGALGLPLEQEYRAMKLYHEALERAHYGQALDLGVEIDGVPQADVSALCDAVIDLKTGSITALAMSLGSLVAGATAAESLALAAFARRFGRALQYFDDLANLCGHVEPAKRYEDLLQRKPTGVWALVADSCAPDDYDAFRAATRRLPDDAPMGRWLAEHDFLANAGRAIRRDVEASLARLQLDLGLTDGHAALAALRGLGEALADAFG